MKKLEAVEQFAWIVPIKNGEDVEYHIALGDYANAVGLKRHLVETEDIPTDSDIICGFLWGLVDDDRNE